MFRWNEQTSSSDTTEGDYNVIQTNKFRNLRKYVKWYTLYCLPICESSKKCATSYCNLGIALDKLSVKEYEAPFKGN